MIGWLWRMIVGRFDQPPRCAHEWEEISKRDLILKNGATGGTLYIMRCKKCGENHSDKITIFDW